MNNYGLGRLPAPDHRDQLFPMRALVPEQPQKKSRFFQSGPILDQGQTPTCVGHAWRQWLTSAPIMTKGGPDPFTIYHEAQKVDEWPGENYDGTSVRAGCKYLQDSGHVANYFWANDAATVRDFLLNRIGSTVVIGSDWLENMFTPQKGFLDVSGAVAGGHAYVLVGYSEPRQAFRMVNSWGKSWGENGRAWIRFADLDGLIRNGGEAVAATEKTSEGGV